MFPIQDQLQTASSNFQAFVDKHYDETTELVNRYAKALFMSFPGLC